MTDPREQSMREVSREEFFKALYAERRDVMPNLVTDRWPYTSEWRFQKLPGKPLFGKTVDALIRPGLKHTTYFLVHVIGGR